MRASASRAPLTSASPRASAIADATNAGIPNGGQRDEHDAGCALLRDRACELQHQTGLPDASWPDERDEACGRISEPASQRLHVSIAAQKGRQRQGQRDAAQFIDGRGVSRCPRARQKRVTRRTGQIKSRGQRAHGLDMRPPSFPAFQRAHRVDREARNRRKFLLRKARRLAERFELRPK